MNPDLVPPAKRPPNWIPFPNPIKESEVRIDLGNWSADARTLQAIKRQASSMDRTPTDYLRHIIASTLAAHEEEDVNGYDPDGVPQDV